MSDISKKGSGVGIPVVPPGGGLKLSKKPSLPPGAAKSGDAKRNALDAATSRALTITAKPAAQPNPNSLDAITKSAAELNAFYKKPFLVHLIVDLTASRSGTRALMIRHEAEIARLVMEAGGRHPVICRGIYHRGGKSSDPIDLTTAQDVEKFFGLSDSAGGTDIQPGLEAYLAHPAKPLLSLGVVIGDSIDGDRDDRLKTVAEKLKEAGRPFIFACEDSTEGHFVKAMQEISGASGGFAFDLAKEPAALVELLQGYKKIFTTPPEELSRQTQQTTRLGGATVLPPSRTQQFLNSQAKRLLLGYSKK